MRALAVVALLSYPWLAAPPAPGGALAERFPTPAGFVRAPVEDASFGAWLRGLPLAPEGTPVRAWDGRVVLAADDPRVAAVVALDVSRADRQQCADTIVRLHAEWLWAIGRRDAHYRTAAGRTMRWRGGDHAAYRAWLEEVFAWANTGSLARDARPVAPAELRPGDFFVEGGWPGHAVIVLDVAREPGDHGRTIALLGQGFMPAQSLHVLRDASGAAWFTLDAGAPVETPFWRAFAWSALRRLD